MEAICEAVSHRLVLEEKHPSFSEEKPTLGILEFEGKCPLPAEEKQEIEGGEGSISSDSSEGEEEEEWDYSGPVHDYKKKYEKFMDFIEWNSENPDPDEDYRLDGASEVDWSVWEKYYKEIKESEGFEIETYPGCCPMAPLMPAWRFKEDPEFYNLIQELANLALEQFNQNHSAEFVFLEIERVVEAPSRGIFYYLTFKAKDSREADADVKTFQAKVLDGIEEREVELCRIKNVVA